MPQSSSYAPDPMKGVLIVDWPLFGELSRALALRVAREYRPDVGVGIATAGVVPGAAIAAILDKPFHSVRVTRRGDPGTVRETPAVLGAAPPEVRGRRVLVVDETCDSGDTIRLAVAAIVNAGAAEVRTAVSFRTGDFQPDFHGLATEAAIVLPWDREILVGDELVLNPKYADVIGEDDEEDDAVDDGYDDELDEDELDDDELDDGEPDDGDDDDPDDDDTDDGWDDRAPA